MRDTLVKVGAHGLKGHFHGPAAQVLGQDLGRRQGGVGAEQGLGLLARRGVPQQQPAQGHRGLTGVIPDSRVGHILQAPHRAVRPPLPERGPDGGGIGQHRVQRGSRAPLRRGRRGCPGARAGGGAYRAASSRRRVRKVTAGVIRGQAASRRRAA